jgi:hypothetical protein
VKYFLALLIAVFSLTTFGADPDSVRGIIKGSLDGELDPVVGEGTMFLFQDLATKKFYVIYTTACELGVEDGQTFNILGKNLHVADEDHKLRLIKLSRYAFDQDNEALDIEGYYEVYSCDDLVIKKKAEK